MLPSAHGGVAPYALSCLTYDAMRREPYSSIPYDQPRLPRLRAPSSVVAEKTDEGATAVHLDAAQRPGGICLERQLLDRAEHEFRGSTAFAASTEPSPTADSARNPHRSTPAALISSLPTVSAFCVQ